MCELLKPWSPFFYYSWSDKILTDQFFLSGVGRGGAKKPASRLKKRLYRCQT